MGEGDRVGFIGGGAARTEKPTRTVGRGFPSWLAPAGDAGPTCRWAGDVGPTYQWGVRMVRSGATWRPYCGFGGGKYLALSLERQGPLVGEKENLTRGPEILLAL